MSFNMDGSPRRVRCVLRRVEEVAKAPETFVIDIDPAELKRVLLKALMPFREAHQSVCNALRAHWPEHLGLAT